MCPNPNPRRDDPLGHPCPFPLSHASYLLDWAGLVVREEQITATAWATCPACRSRGTLFLAQNDDEIERWRCFWIPVITAQCYAGCDQPAVFRALSRLYRRQRQWQRRATRREAQARPDVAGARAARNGAVAALPGVPGHPAYRMVIGRLREAGHPVENAETGQALARCPVHDDEHPSLAVGIGRAGVVLDCKAGAGCTYGKVMAALDLDPADGFDNSSRYDDYDYDN